MSIRDLIPWNWGKKHDENEQGKRDEVQSLSVLRNEMNRLFDDFFHGVDRDWGLSALNDTSLFSGGLLSNGPATRVDVSETDSEIEITAELPGMTGDDLDVTVTDNVLRIRGEKKQEREEKKKDYHLTERLYGSFHREIPLWAEVDTEKVDAQFKKGVLHLRLPKVEDSTPSKRITVRST